MKNSNIIRVALIQMRSEKAAIAQNLASIAQCIRAASRRGIDIVGFPEMSLTGYADPTRSPEAILSLDGPEVEQLLQITRKFSGTVLAGLIEMNPEGKPFITQVAVRRGDLIGSYRKLTIQDEETLWFSAGRQVPIFHHAGLPFGVAICADLTNREVFAQISRQGARLIFELAAPGLYGNRNPRNWQSGYDWWEGECRQHLSGYARAFNTWILVATQAGATIDEDFPGGAFVFAPGGERVFATSDWQPGMVFLEIDLKSQRVSQLP
jgi:predicted amidohydrolase